MIEHAEDCAKVTGLNIQLETCIVALGCTCDALAKANARIEELEKFARHAPDCEAIQPMWKKGPCDCGFAALTGTEAADGRS